MGNQITLTEALMEFEQTYLAKIEESKAEICGEEAKERVTVYYCDGSFEVDDDLSEEELWERAKEKAYSLNRNVDKADRKETAPTEDYFKRVDRKKRRESHFEQYGYYPYERKTLNYFERVDEEDRRIEREIEKMYFEEKRRREAEEEYFRDFERMQEAEARLDKMEKEKALERAKEIEFVNLCREIRERESEEELEDSSESDEESIFSEEELEENVTILDIFDDNYSVLGAPVEDLCPTQETTVLTVYRNYLHEMISNFNEKMNLQSERIMRELQFLLTKIRNLSKSQVVFLKFCQSSFLQGKVWICLNQNQLKSNLPTLVLDSFKLKRSICSGRLRRRVTESFKSNRTVSNLEPKSCELIIPGSKCLIRTTSISNDQPKKRVMKLKRYLTQQY